MKYIGIFVAALVGLTLFGMIFRVVMFPVQTANNMIDTAYDANKKVINADNAIYNYEWFKQQKADIDATKRQYSLAKQNYDSYVVSLGDRKEWGFEDKTEVARLNTVVLGLQTNLESQIADYNARASMATRNIFEDHVLPDYIDALTFIRQ